MYSIRPLSETEIPQFFQLFTSSLQNDYPEYPTRVANQYKKIFDKNFFTQLFQKNKGVILGAFLDKLIGFIVVQKDDGGVVKFHWFAVDKNYRKQGIGSSLLRAAEKWCLENKCHYIFFYTENSKNVEYYKKRGFRLVGIQKNSWFGVDEYLIDKQLRNTPFQDIFTHNHVR